MCHENPVNAFKFHLIPIKSPLSLIKSLIIHQQKRTKSKGLTTTRRLSPSSCGPSFCMRRALRRNSSNSSHGPGVWRDQQQDVRRMTTVMAINTYKSVYNSCNLIRFNNVIYHYCKPVVTGTIIGKTWARSPVMSGQSWCGEVLWTWPNLGIKGSSILTYILRETNSLLWNNHHFFTGSYR